MFIQITRAVKILLIINVVAFILQNALDQFFGANLFTYFALTPSILVFKLFFWQIVTYSFLHADVMHLVFNCVVIALFAGELETLWGTKRFLKYYLFCAVSVGVIYVVIQSLGLSENSSIHDPIIGASGAIFGLLTAYGILFSERTLLFMLLLPMKAKYFVFLIGGVEMMILLFSRTPSAAFSSLAHLSGMFMGFLYLWFETRWRQKNPVQRTKKRKKRDHLKLLVNTPEDLKNVKKQFESDEHSDDDPDTWH